MDGTLEQEYVRCGKPACRRCKTSKGHGPYWYLYKRQGGKLTKRYIGKRLPSTPTPTTGPGGDEGPQS